MSNIIAKAMGAKITILHIESPRKHLKIDKLKNKIKNGFNGLKDIEKDDIIIEESGDILKTIIEYSRNYDLLILNTPRDNIFKMFFMGNKAQYIAKHSFAPVLLIKKYEGKLKAILQKFFGTRLIDL